MTTRPRLIAFALLLSLVTSGAHAYEIHLRYYKVRDPELAESLHQIKERFDEMEDPLKEVRRSAGYNTPEHERATAELEAIRARRDGEFLRLLEGTPPEFHYTTRVDVDEVSQESGTSNEKPLHTNLRLHKRDGDHIPVQIDVEYDGRTLYKGSALLVPLATPYLVTRAFARIQGRRQGTMLFVEVRP